MRALVVAGGQGLRRAGVLGPVSRRPSRECLDAADLVTAPSRAMADAVAEHYGSRRLPRHRQWPVREPLPSRREGALRLHRRPAVGRREERRRGRRKRRRACRGRSTVQASAGQLRRRPTGATMLGHLAPDALADWYSRAAIYALPARYEPFGLSALEAAHSGCALVLGDIPSLREIWGDAAIFVPPDDTGALADAIEALIADPERRESMARAAWEHALQYTPAPHGRGLPGGLSVDRARTEADCALRNLHAFSGFGLESRQRAFPPWRRDRARRCRPRGAHLRAARRLESCRT